MIRDYKFGIIVGFIFGIISIFLAVLGLVSSVGGTLGYIFRFPGPLIGKFLVFQTSPNSYNTSLAMPAAIVLNGIFYATIGGLLQKWFKKKKWVVLTFIGVIIIFIFAIIIETIIRSSLDLHIGA